MWKRISTKKIFTHPRIELWEDVVELPNGEKTDYLRYDESQSCIVSVLCKREDGKILVQKQLSYPYNKDVYQFPGGRAGIDEKKEVAANRELSEESDVMAGRLELLGKHLLNNRRSTQMDYVFLGTDIKDAPSDCEPEEEDTQNIWMSVEEIDGLIRKGEDVEGNMLCAWAMYKVYKEK